MGKVIGSWVCILIGGEGRTSDLRNAVFLQVTDELHWGELEL
jgi:hypothetical protein